MRWSKVRKLTEESFADSVRGRVTIHVTNADPHGVSWKNTCKRSWISVDRRTVAMFDRHACRFIVRGHDRDAAWRRMEYNFTPDETWAQMDLLEASWDYLQSKVSDSLASQHPFVQSLAVLSGRVGKQRLRRLSQQELHPLVRTILDFRLRAEEEFRSIATAKATPTEVA